MADADDHGFVNRHGLSRKVSWPFAWELTHLGLTYTL